MLIKEFLKYGKNDAIYILTLLLEYNVCKVLEIDIKTKTASYIQRYFYAQNRDKQQ